MHIIWCIRSDMKLKVNSDASYMSIKAAHSRVVGFFYLVVNATNGVIFTDWTILKMVVSSDSEDEYAGLFINSRHSISFKNILEALHHKQFTTQIWKDNAMVVVIANLITKPKMSKSMDMQFHWLQDRDQQSQFIFVWKPGYSNFLTILQKNILLSTIKRWESYTTSIILNFYLEFYERVCSYNCEPVNR